MGLLKMTEAFRRRGKFDHAESLMALILQTYTMLYGTDKLASIPTFAGVLLTRAGLFQTEGYHELAEEHYLKSLQMYHEHPGQDPDGTNTIQAQMGLARVFLDQTKLEEAEAAHRKCKKMLVDLFGTNTAHPLIATELMHWGLLLMKKGSFDASESSMLKSLDMKYELFGSEVNHWEIAITLLNLGIVYKLQGKMFLAETKYLDSLKMWRELRGIDSNHTDIARVLLKLGHLYCSQEMFDLAESKYMDSINMLAVLQDTEEVNSLLVEAMAGIGYLEACKNELMMAELKCILDREKP